MGDLDCVSCVSDGLCVCSFVSVVVCVSPSKICVSLTNLSHRYSATTLSLPVHAHGILGEAVRQTLRARGGGVEHGVGVGRLDCGRDVGDVVGQEGLGRRAALAVLREVGGAGEPRLLREDAYCNRCNGRRDWVSRDSNSV